MNLNFNKFYLKQINESLSIKKKLKNLSFNKKILLCINKIHLCIKSGGKLLLCGNGGSAADAQHLVAEFLVRLRSHVNRKPIPALSLAMDTSTITACSNDYSFKYLFSRNLEALGSEKDILIVISTSGNSQNILETLRVAKKKNIYSIAFLGNDGGKAKDIANTSIIIPSKITARIQECHIFLGHLIIEAVEDILVKSYKII